jgi:2-succinyl-6-hydroxy-2,4-cyclohexadiene-1-carboxylate synthase
MSSSSLLNYEIWGDASASPIVFLHGFMGNARDWMDVIERLDNTYCCIAIDLPGHGKSLKLSNVSAYTLPGAAHCVVYTMQQAQAIPAAVVGYSMGGRLALYLARHFKEVCSRLVVESATAGIRKETQRQARQQSDEEKARDLERGRFEEFLRTWYGQPVFASLAENPQELEKVLHRRRSNEPSELAKALRGMSVGAQAPLWSDLPGLAMPVLLMAGERDEKYIDIVKAVASLLPSAAVEIVPGAGHNVHVENGSAMAERIRQFLPIE